MGYEARGYGVRVSQLETKIELDLNGGRLNEGNGLSISKFLTLKRQNLCNSALGCLSFVISLFVFVSAFLQFL